MRGWRLVLTALIVVAGAVGVFGQVEPTAAASVVTVTGGGCDFEGLEAAIAAAADGDVITFDCPANTTINFENRITISKTLTIDGSNGGDGPIVFDGGEQTSFFSIDSRIDSNGNLTLRGLTLQNGKTGSDGGAIYNLGTLTILQSSFTGNQADFNGGAIRNAGTLTILQSSFTSNQAGNDSGAIESDGTLTILQSSFTGNQAAGEFGDGGAIRSAGTLMILQSSFVNNHAEDLGGAIYLSIGASQVTSSTFSGNSAGDNGSAIFVSPAVTSASISWSTIVQPGDTSAALHVDGPLAVEGVIVAGCVVVDDGTLTPNYLVIDGTWCVGMGSTPGIVGDVATMEVNGVTQTYYPLPDGSLEIDAAGDDCREPLDAEEPEVLDTSQPFGDIMLTLWEWTDYEELDQLGTIRPQAGEDAACDIGAIEMTDSISPVITGLAPTESPVYEGSTPTIGISISDADSEASNLYTVITFCRTDEIGNVTVYGNHSMEEVLDAAFDCPSTPDQGLLEVWSAVSDGVSVRETFRFFEVLNADPVFTRNFTATPRQVLTGQLVTLDAEAADVAADPLTYTYDCGGGTLVGTNQCRFDQVGDYQVSVVVDDGDGGQISDLLTVSVFDAARLCANAWTGQLRMADDCGRSETLIALPLENFGALSLCVNDWNGAARLGVDCDRSEHLVTTRGQDTLPVCVNRWNGVLRVSDRCGRSERQDWL